MRMRLSKTRASGLPNTRGKGALSANQTMISSSQTKRKLTWLTTTKGDIRKSKDKRGKKSRSKIMEKAKVKRIDKGWKE